MGLDVVRRTFYLFGEAAMRRPVQVLCIAAAVLAAGGTVWAIGAGDFLGHYLQLTPQSDRAAQPPASSGQRVATPPPATAPAAQQRREVLSIEVARIDARGSSVFAGRSPPDHRVTVLANGREIGTTIATEDGQWAIVIDEGITTGSVELGIRSRPVAGGPEVVGLPRHLVVPGPQVADTTAKVPAAAPPATRTASAAPASSGTNATGTPTAAKSAIPPPAAPKTAQSPAQPQGQPKGAQSDDQKALERFAAIVAKERDAAAAREREASTSGAATTVMPATPSTQPGNPLATGVAKAPDAAVAPSRLAAATPPSHRQDATDSEPGRVAASKRTDPTTMIPVPITFVSNQSALTDSGARAAALLAEYIRLKNPASVTLSGHADARGPDGYNMRLSLKRLQAIERYLRAAGYSGGLSLVPRGKRDPYQGIDRRRLALSEIYQADRRVELRLTP